MSGGGHGHGGGGRRRGHEEEHEEHENHERWLVSYADMMTLLMVLFIVLYAISQVDSAKFAALKTGLAQGFGAPLELLSGSDALLDAGGAVAPDSVDITGKSGTSQSNSSSSSPSASTSASSGDSQSVNPEAVAELAAATSESQVAKEVSNLKKAETDIQNALSKAGENKKATFRFNERGLVVTIATDKVLFPSGSAQLSAEGQKILNTIAPTLEGLPNNLSVEGHTDSNPIHTSQFPTNWELSTSRATNVLRYLHGNDTIPYGRMSATGFADTEPLVAGTTAASNAANRRVEIVVLARVDNSEGAAVESLGNSSTGASPLGSGGAISSDNNSSTGSSSGSGSNSNRDAFIKGAANAGKQLSR